MQKSLTLLMTICVSLLMNAQVHIPFRLTSYNNIIVKTLVNDKDSLDLMFQIAMQGAAISPMRVHKVENISFDKEEYSPSNKVQIGGQVWDNIAFENNQMSGYESDGKIGMSLFKDKVLEINYDQSEFLVYDGLPTVEGYTAIPILYRNGVMFIDVTSLIGGKGYTHKFYLQSGYSGVILYDDNFAEVNKLSEQLVTISEKELKNAQGKSVITKNAVIGQLEVGGMPLKEVSVGYFEGELKNQPLSVFGADMLKRFNWIISADRAVAWVKPSKYFSSPYFGSTK